MRDFFIDILTKKNQNHTNPDRFRKPSATDITLSNYSNNVTDKESAAHHFMLQWLYDLLLNQDKKNKMYQTVIKTMECNGFKQEQIQELNWKILNTCRQKQRNMIMAMATVGKKHGPVYLAMHSMPWKQQCVIFTTVVICIVQPHVLLWTI